MVYGYSYFRSGDDIIITDGNNKVVWRERATASSRLEAVRLCRVWNARCSHA